VWGLHSSRFCFQNGEKVRRAPLPGRREPGSSAPVRVSAYDHWRNWAIAGWPEIFDQAPAGMQPREGECERPNEAQPDAFSSYSIAKISG
jgi:hypothetical protein